MLFFLNAGIPTTPGHHINGPQSPQHHLQPTSNCGSNLGPTSSQNNNSMHLMQLSSPSTANHSQMNSMMNSHQQNSTPTGHQGSVTQVRRLLQFDKIDCVACWKWPINQYLRKVESTQFLVPYTKRPISAWKVLPPYRNDTVYAHRLSQWKQIKNLILLNEN